MTEGVDHRGRIVDLRQERLDGDIGELAQSMPTSWTEVRSKSPPPAPKGAPRRRDDLERIRDTLDQGTDPSIDMDQFLATDIDFPVAICRAAKNSVLERVMTAIHLARPWTNTVVFAMLDRKQIADELRHIYEAIRDSDVEAAGRALDAHMKTLGEPLERALEDRRERDIPIAALTTEAHPDPDTILRRRR